MTCYTSSAWRVSVSPIRSPVPRHLPLLNGAAACAFWRATRCPLESACEAPYTDAHVVVWSSSNRKDALCQEPGPPAHNLGTHHMQQAANAMSPPCRYRLAESLSARLGAGGATRGPSPTPKKDRHLTERKAARISLGAGGFPAAIASPPRELWRDPCPRRGAAWRPLARPRVASSCPRGQASDVAAHAHRSACQERPAGPCPARSRVAT